MGEYANLHLLRMNSREYSPSISNSFTGLDHRRAESSVTSTASLIISISNESFTKRSRGAREPNGRIRAGKSRSLIDEAVPGFHFVGGPVVFVVVQVSPFGFEHENLEKHGEFTDPVN